MIITVTLNPAIDKTLLVENFDINEVNKIKDVKINAGGKGINASRVIKSLGEKSTALGFLGGNTGLVITNTLNELNICNHFVAVKEDTRINTKVIDLINNTCTDINEPGGNISSQEVEELMKIINKHINDSKCLILAGSAPKGIKDSIYRDIINSTDKSKTKTILDASGKLLEEGIKAGPWMIKPNIHELEELLKKNLRTIDDIIQESKKLVDAGISYVCVSMGKNGLLLVGKDIVLHAKPPKVIAKNTVGAGDSVVGSLAVSLIKNEDMKESLKNACAISAASVTIDSTEIPDYEYVKEFYKDIKIINHR